MFFLTYIITLLQQHRRYCLYAEIVRATNKTIVQFLYTRNRPYEVFGSGSALQISGIFYDKQRVVS